MKLLIPLLSLLLTFGVAASEELDGSVNTASPAQTKSNSQNKNKIEKGTKLKSSNKKENLNKILILNMLLKQKSSSGK